MTMEKKSSFGDKIHRNSQKQKSDNRGFGYLTLPDGVSQYKLKEGVKEVELDFFPYEVTDPKHPDHDEDIAAVGELWYRRPLKVHTNVGTKKEAIICPRMLGKKCPICDYQDKRRTEKADKEEIKKLYPKPRSLYIIDDGESKEIVPQVWDMSDHLFQKTLNEELDLDEDLRSFPDLKNGKTLKLKIIWEELDERKFPKIRSITPIDRDPIKDTILDKVPNLDECFKVLSYDEIEAKFFEMEKEEDAGELKDADEPRRRRRDEEEEPERNERRRSRDEQEEEAPRRRRSEESEEEEEEKPRRKRQEEDEEKEEPKVTRTRSREPEEDKPSRSKRQEEEPAEESKPQRTKRPASDSSNGVEKKCPHGHKFGVDADDFDDCERCDVWGKCLDQKEGK